MESDQQEMKAEVMAIPLASIRLNPNNRPIRPEQVEAVAGSMAKVGQKTPVKLRRRSEAERQQANPDLEYEMIGGHVRYQAAQKLGWANLAAIVLQVDAKGAVLEAILDNPDREPNWLEDCLNVEKLFQIEPGLGQEEAAQILGIDQSEVSKRKKALKLLNNSARQAIYENFINASQNRIYPEVCVRRILDSVEGENEAAQKQVEERLKVALERNLSEAECNKLLAWVQEGHTPDSFPGADSAEVSEAKPVRFSQDDPKAQLWQALPENIKIFQKAKGYQVILSVKTYEAAVAAFSAADALSNLQERLGDGAHNLSYQAQLNQALESAVEEAKQVKEEQEKAKQNRAAKARAKRSQKANERRAQQEAEEVRAKQQAEEKAKQEREALQAELRQKLSAIMGTAPSFEMTYQGLISGDKAKLQVLKALLVPGPEGDETLAWFQDAMQKLSGKGKRKKEGAVPMSAQVHAQEAAFTPEEFALASAWIKVMTGREIDKLPQDLVNGAIRQANLEGKPEVVKVLMQLYSGNGAA